MEETDEHYLTTNKVVALRKNGGSWSKKDTQKLIDSLTDKQRQFCEEYMKDLNASKAVMRAGYNTKYPNRVGVQLLQNAKVKMAIDALLNQKKQNNDVTADYVLRKIIRIVEKAEEADNHNASLRGLELIAKHLGMFVERKEISGPDGGAIEYERRVQEDAAGLESAITRLANRGGKTGLAIVPDTGTEG